MFLLIPCCIFCHKVFKCDVLRSVQFSTWSVRLDTLRYFCKCKVRKLLSKLSLRFGDPSSFICYICDFIFRIGIISVIKLYSSIFDTFNYLNYVREQVTDKADHAVKGTYSVFFLEHLNHVIKRILTCAFSMRVLSTVGEDLVFIQGVIPNIYKQDS